MKRCPHCSKEFDGADWTCPVCGHRPQAEPFVTFVDAAAPVDYATEGYDDEQWNAFEAANGFWFRPRAELIAQLIAKHFGTPATFLEVGCGAGGVMAKLAERFPAMHITGGEPAAGGLEIAAKRVPHAELLLMDALEIPFRDEFDVVGAFDVIEHLEDDRGAIREMAASARPGGGIVITVPQHPWLWSRYDEAGGHHRRYTRRGLTDAMKAEGLRIERVTSFVTTLLPLVALSRYRANRAEDYDVLAFDSEPKPAAGALEWALRREVRLIARGVNLPVGSSLVVVARRR